MKKHFKFLTVIVFGTLLTVSAAGCGLFGNNENQTETDTSVVSSEAEESSEAESSIEESSKENSIEVLESSEEESSKEDSSKAESSEESELDFVDFSGTEQKDMTLKECFESPTYASLIKSTEKQMSNDTYDVKITLNGENEIVITATSKTQINVTGDNAAAIQAAFDTAGSQAAAYIPTFENLTSTKDIKVTTKLVNADGTEITSASYTKEDAPQDSETAGENVSAYSSVKEFAESDLFKGQIKAISSSIGIDGAEINVSVEGEHKLVLNILYPESVPDEAVPTLKETFAASSSNYSSIAGNLQTVTADSQASVVLRFTDADGKAIYEEEFK
ncbi:MAG: DUF4854 domain-containing protein [Clostridia bacterium]|nr:DUF4854 domain-containing protein [Clostridia bacterium]